MPWSSLGYLVIPNLSTPYRNDPLTRPETLSPKPLDLGYCTPPVTVYMRGPTKGYIYPYYNYYPTITKGAVPNLDPKPLNPKLGMTS